MKYLTLKLSDSKYPEVSALMDSVISSVLPHENCDIEIAKVTLDELFKTVELEEVYGLWYIVFKIFKQMQVVKMYMSNYSGVLSREVFETALESGCRTFIQSENFNYEQYCDEREISKPWNLTVESELYDAASAFFSDALEWYDRLFERKVPSIRGSIDLISLKQKINEVFTKQMITLASETLIAGRTYYNGLKRGPDDTRELLSTMISEVNARVSTMGADYSDRFTPDPIRSFEDFKVFKERNRVAIKDLYYMGIDPIDDSFCIRTQDIITIVADEGVGKTRFAVDQCYKAIIQGLNVLYICGESAKIKIENMLLSTHLWEMYKISLSWDEVQNPNKIKTTNVDTLEQRIVELNSAAHDFHSNPKYGKFIPQQSAWYETFYDDIKKTCENYDISIVIVDHVLALTSNGDFTPMGRLQNKQLRITHLYQCEDMLVKDCNIAFINTSHPSSDTSRELKDGKKPTSRTGAESSESSRYSTIMGVLHNNDELRNQDLVILYMTKTRDEKQITEPLVLRRTGYPCQHVYDPEIQHLASGSEDLVSQKDLESLFMGEESSLD